MTEMDEIKLAAYNSYKRHMRVLDEGKGYPFPCRVGKRKRVN